MAIFHWVGGHGNSFANALNWNPQQQPSAGDDALIDLTGAFTVQAAGSFGVNRLALAAQATLEVAGSFAAAGGSAPGGIGGHVVVDSGSALDLGGAVALTGTIALNAAGAATALVLTSSTLTLSGHGRVVLSDDAENQITGGSGDVLVNAGVTIVGAGTIGAGELSFVNAAGGVVAARASHPLIIQVPAKVIPGQPNFQLQNAGTLEALAGSTLEVQPSFGSVLQNSGGTLLAAGVGAVVAVGGIVDGGTLRTGGGGRIATTGALTTLDGLALHPVTNAGTLLISAQSPLALQGSIVNTGSILQDFDHSELDIASPVVTLSGGGRLVLAEANVNRVLATVAGFSLVNLDNQIIGAGQLGLGTLTLVNHGTIIANRAAGLLDNQLIVNTGTIAVVNTGLMEATNTGGLRLSSPVLNQGGIIAAGGGHAHVDLDGGTIIGGTLTTAGNGSIDLVAETELDGLSAGALVNAGLLLVPAVQTVELAGTIVNSGTIVLQAVGSGTGQTAMAVRSQTVTLTGGGRVVMGDGQALIEGGDFNALVNVDNIIVGQGQIGDGVVDMPIFNSGTIEAFHTASRCGRDRRNLFIDTGGRLLTNTGLLEAATNTDLAPDGLIANAGGTIAAVGFGAVVFLEDATVEGGLLRTSGGGLIFASLSSRLDGLNDGALSNTGTVTIGKDVTVDLLGSIVNTGVLSVVTSASPGETDIVLRSPIVTLSGHGRLVLSNTDTVLRGGGNGERLVNVDNTISGPGTLGSADMQFTNGGRVLANFAAAMTIELAGMTNGATGTLQATGAGGLVLAGGVFSNAGTVEADVGSSVNLQFGVSLTNLEEGVLQGGTWRVIAGADASTITFGDGSVVVDAANITLSGAGAQLISGTGALGSAPLEHSLTSITAAGALHLLAGRDFTASNTLAVAGLLQLGGGTLQAPALTLAAGSRLLGFGTVADALPNAGRIEALGGALAVSGAISGAGTLQVDAGATLTPRRHHAAPECWTTARSRSAPAIRCG